MENEENKVSFPGSKKQDSFGSVWPGINQTIMKLFREEHVNVQEWKDVILWVHHCSLNDDMEALNTIYNSVLKGVLGLIKGVKRELYALLNEKDDQSLVCAYVEEWQKYSTLCDFIPLKFFFIEREIKRKLSPGVENEDNGESSLRTFMCEKWNSTIFSKFHCIILLKALHLVESERYGEIPDSQLSDDIFFLIGDSYMNWSSSSEVDLEVYFNTLERMYLQGIKTFYCSNAAKYLEEHGVNDYMRYALVNVEEEQVRASKYLHSCFPSLQIFKECTVEILVANFKDLILEKYPEMIKNNETENLHCMYMLMKMIPDGVDSMARDFKDHIIKQGLAELATSKDTTSKLTRKYLQVLEQLFNIFRNLVKNIFDNDPRLLTAKNQALQQLVNETFELWLELPSGLKSMINNIKPEYRCPCLLARYCDMLLKSTILSKELTSEEIEERLNQVVLLLKYVEQKHAFLNYYKFHLTRRLLRDSTTDREKEESMLKMFRDVGMPGDGIYKLTRMFEDVKVSETFNGELKNIHESSNRNLDINIKILNEFVWFNSRESEAVSLPAELNNFATDVEEFYQREHPGRNLKWCHDLSTGTITFRTKVGTFELDVTAFQMAVLFTWNDRDGDKISFRHLKLSTKLPDAALRRTLWSLVAAQNLKRQPLQFEPKVTFYKNFNERTLFWINEDFAIMKNDEHLKQGRVNLIGSLQLPNKKN